MQEFGFTGHLTGSWQLFRVALTRLARSRQTLVCLLLIGFVAMVVTAWSMRRDRSPEDFVEIFLVLHVSFLLPMFCLSSASSGIAADREEKTLVYLLVSPLPRPLVYLAKFSAAAVLAVFWTMGSLLLMVWLAGSAGLQSLPLLWPSVLLSTLGYVAMFLVLSALFRRATIISLVYALFVETFVGNMPGTAKRIAVSFYTKCMIFESVKEIDIEMGESNMFVPIPGDDAFTTLAWVVAGLVVLGIFVFSRREYSN
jgi:ABC-type transport system involved in multi-copper enzyme maturation permease subunit